MPGIANGTDVLRDRLRLPNTDNAGYWAAIGTLVGFMLFFRLLGILFVARKLRG